MIHGELDITVEMAVQLMDANIERLRIKYKGKLKNKESLIMGELVAIFHPKAWSQMIVHIGYLEIEPELTLHISGRALPMFFGSELIAEWYLGGTKKHRDPVYPTQEQLEIYKRKYGDVIRQI